MDFYDRALKISNEMISLRRLSENLPGWNKESAFNFAYSFYKERLPEALDIVRAGCSISDRESTPEDDAKYIYLFVILFNCVKKMTALYAINNRSARWSPGLQKDVMLAALRLSWKSLGLDETCVGRSGSMPAFTEYSAWEKPLSKIENEMLRLSNYTPCKKEYKDVEAIMKHEFEV